MAEGQLQPVLRFCPSYGTPQMDTYIPHSKKRIPSQKVSLNSPWRPNGFSLESVAYRHA